MKNTFIPDKTIDPAYRLQRKFKKVFGSKEDKEIIKNEELIEKLNRKGIVKK